VAQKSLDRFALRKKAWSQFANETFIQIFIFVKGQATSAHSGEGQVTYAPPVRITLSVTKYAKPIKEC